MTHEYNGLEFPSGPVHINLQLIGDAKHQQDVISSLIEEVKPEVRSFCCDSCSI